MRFIKYVTRISCLKRKQNTAEETAINCMPKSAQCHFLSAKRKTLLKLRRREDLQNAVRLV